jgi:hypothetical protein
MTVTDDLVKRLWLAKLLEQDGRESMLPQQAADRIEQLIAEVERLREALTMCVAEMMRASGRLEIIATCNEDRRIVAALSGTCDYVRSALGGSNE